MFIPSILAGCPNPSPTCETIQGSYVSDYSGRYFSKVMNHAYCIPIESDVYADGQRILGYYEADGGPKADLKDCIRDKKVSFHAKAILYKSLAATLGTNAYNSYLVVVGTCSAIAVSEGIDKGAECSKEAYQEFIDQMAKIFTTRILRTARAANLADDAIDQCISTHGGWTGACADRYGAR